MTTEPGVAVAVERCWLGVDEQGFPHWGLTRVPLVGGQHPDDVALDNDRQPILMHSTSWRYDDGGIVLTYACVIPGVPRGLVKIDTDLIVTSRDALHPTPVMVHGHHVAAHAIEHLVHLVRHDPVVARAAREHPRIFGALVSAAGGLHRGQHPSAATCAVTA